MDINQQIYDNLGLVYTQLGRFGLYDDQDAESLAYEALHKALITYDSASKTAFSTYAVCVISNALRMHMRHKNRKRQIEYSSYDAHIGGTDSSVGLDVLQGPDSTVQCFDNKELRRDIRRALRTVYDSLTTDNQRAVFLKWYDSDFSLTQKELASETGLAQASVSRMLSSFRYKLKQELEEYV